MVSCHPLSCLYHITVRNNVDMSVVPARQSFNWSEVVCCLQGPFKATTTASMMSGAECVCFVLPALLRILQLSWMEYSRNGNINTKMQSSGCQPQSSSTLTLFL